MMNACSVRGIMTLGLSAGKCSARTIGNVPSVAVALRYSNSTCKLAVAQRGRDEISFFNDTERDLTDTPVSALDCEGPGGVMSMPRKPPGVKVGLPFNARQYGTGERSTGGEIQEGKDPTVRVTQTGGAGLTVTEKVCASGSGINFGKTWNAMTKKRTVLPENVLQRVTSAVKEMEGDVARAQEILRDPLVARVEFERELVWNFYQGTTKEEKAKYRVNQKKRKRSRMSGSWDSTASPRAARPNYFLAVPITNPAISSKMKEVQDAIIDKKRPLKDIVVSVATAHLTIMVMRLEDEEQLEKAKTALDDSYERLKEAQLHDDVVVLNVERVGTFRDEVLFAKVREDEALEKLYKIADVVQTCFAKHEIGPSDNLPFKPHITIMKLSKKPALKKKGIKKIKPDYYSEFTDAAFGPQPVTCVQLCAMTSPKDERGYYQVPHFVPLGGADYIIESPSAGVFSEARNDETGEHSVETASGETGSASKHGVGTQSDGACVSGENQTTGNASD